MSKTALIVDDSKSARVVLKGILKTAEHILTRIERADHHEEAAHIKTVT